MYAWGSIISPHKSYNVFSVSIFGFVRAHNNALWRCEKKWQKVENAETFRKIIEAEKLFASPRNWKTDKDWKRMCFYSHTPVLSTYIQRTYTYVHVYADEPQARRTVTLIKYKKTVRGFPAFTSYLEHFCWKNILIVQIGNKFNDLYKILGKLRRKTIVFIYG